MTALHATGILDEVELDRRIEAAIARTRETLAEAAASGQLPLDVAKQAAAEGIARDMSDFAGAC